MNRLLSSVFVFTLIFSGCNEKSQAPSVEMDTAKEIPAQAAPAASGIDLSKTGSLKGRIAFAGEVAAPAELSVKGNPECAALHSGGKVMSEELLVKEGGLKNAVVYIKEGLEGVTFEAPKEPATVSNTNCIYVPHVIAVQVGQPVNFLNNDSTLHNVHAYPKTNKSFNLGLPFINMKQTKTFTQTEVAVPLKCDVHPWMLGYVAALPHPFFAVTDENGAYEIKNVPAGEYTLEIWHEKLGVRTEKVKIETGSAAEAGTTF